LHDLPAEAPPETTVTAAFNVAAAGPITLELARGIVNPGDEVALPSPPWPMLLLALDSPIRLQIAGTVASNLVRDQSALLTAAATIHNDGSLPASFVVARIATLPAAATPPAATQTFAPLDSVVDEAWRRNGCHLNPGNAACMAVGIAAACAIDPSGGACATDGDGDGCTDVAEIRAAFDPYDPSDCISDGQGGPAINCLFPTQDMVCDGGPSVPFPDDCAPAGDNRLRRSTTNLNGCDVATPPPDPCAIAARDPLCDGFAPGSG
jgi:hypothetical protein